MRLAGKLAMTVILSSDADTVRKNSHWRKPGMLVAASRQARAALPGSADMSGPEKGAVLASPQQTQTPTTETAMVFW